MLKPQNNEASLLLPNPIPIMLSALQHVSYCPRQYALIHIEQEFSDNVYTQRGHHAHERVDSGLDELKPDGVKLKRSLELASNRHGIYGKADVVEFHPNGRIFPVEYKSGKRHQRLHDDIQLAAQALCLEEMFDTEVLEGAVYSIKSKKRRTVNIDAGLRHHVLNAIETIRGIQATGQLPAPNYDARCEKCSLYSICQPELLANASTQHQTEWEALFHIQLNEDEA
jgi:CRISPR-associated exonuclease Cas4